MLEAVEAFEPELEEVSRLMQAGDLVSVHDACHTLRDE